MMPCREPRPADLAAIAELEAQAASLRQQLGSLEQRHQRLRQELLLREDVYNKTFAAGGAAAKMSVGGAAAASGGLVDWMLRAAPGPHGSGAAGGGTHLPALGGRRSSGGRGPRP